MWWSLLGIALAAEPTHLRIAAAPPTAWADLEKTEVTVRVWWDGTAANGEIEAAVRGRWKSLGTSLAPGWESPSLPRGTALRVRLDEGDWSAPIYVPRFIGPTDLARMMGHEHSLLAGMVGQLVSTEDGLWGSTLGGGLVHVKDGEVRSLTRWDGMPDDTVLAVDAKANRVLAGTAQGAVLLENGIPVKVWDEELPYRYAQAVLLDADEAFVGTAGGLAKVLPEVEVLDESTAVYSLASADAGGLWAGMRGLRRIEPDGTVGPVIALDGDRIYSIVEQPDGLWIATDKHAVQVGSADALSLASGLPEHWAVALAAAPDGMWAAMGEFGLVGPDERAFGYADGLPDRSVWSVAAGRSGSLWVGTGRGIARVVPGPSDQSAEVDVLPLSEWPARSPLWVGAVGWKGLWLAGDEGVRFAGHPHRYAENLAVGGPETVRALVSDRKWTWAVGRWSITGMDRKGRLRQAHLRSPASDAALHKGHLWLGGRDGISQLDLETMQVKPWVDLPGVSRLVPGRRVMWAIADQVPVQIVGRIIRPFMQSHAVEDLAPSGDTVCLGTTGGLKILFPDGEVLDGLGPKDDADRVTAVAADGRGGCWYVNEEGEVGRTSASDDAQSLSLPLAEPVGARRIVADGDWAWVITEIGTWRVHLPPS